MTISIRPEPEMNRRCNLPSPVVVGKDATKPKPIQSYFDFGLQRNNQLSRKLKVSLVIYRIASLVLIVPVLLRRRSISDMAYLRACPFAAPYQTNRVARANLQYGENEYDNTLPNV